MQVTPLPAPQPVPTWPQPVNQVPPDNVQRLRETVAELTQGRIPVQPQRMGFL